MAKQLLVDKPLTLAAALCGAAGLGLGVATGSAPLMVFAGSALGGVFSNLATDACKAASDHFKLVMAGPGAPAQNHDLALLAGKSIAAIVEDARNSWKGSPGGHGFLKAAARLTPEQFKDSLSHPQFASISTQQLIEFLGLPEGGLGEQAATESIWYKLLVHTLKVANPNRDLVALHGTDTRGLVFAARRLWERFPAQFNGELRNDPKYGGRAWVAFQSRMLRRVVEITDTMQEDWKRHQAEWQLFVDRVQKTLSQISEGPVVATLDSGDKIAIEIHQTRNLAGSLYSRIKGVEDSVRELHLAIDNDPRLSVALKSAASRYFGHPIGALRHEPAWQPELLTPSMATLVYGPPRIGKSCWVLRAAIEWLAGSTGHAKEVAYFNATERKASEVRQYLSRFAEAQEVILIIDDFHFGSETEKEVWIDAVRDVYSQRTPCDLQTCVWVVSRDSDDFRFLNSLNGIPSQPAPLAYPIDRVVDMFLGERASSKYSKHQMFIAALVGRLDPALPRMLERNSTNAQQDRVKQSQWSIVRDDVELAERRATDDWLGYVHGCGVLSSYKACLPLASLDLAADYSFYSTLLPDSFDGDIIAMRRVGLAMEDSFGRVKLLEHPFQVRRTLAHLTGRRGMTPLPGMRDLYGPEIARASLPAAVVAAFILSDDQSGRKANPALMIERTKLLQDHAEWTGFRDVLADALDEICNRQTIWNLIPPDVRPTIRESSLKVRRLASQKIETLHEQQSEWKARLHAVRDGSDREGRSDYFLYEIGYIDYLLGNRELAIAILDESVLESVQCIFQNLSTPVEVGSKEWTHGWMALANVWVAYLVSENAKLEQDALSDEPAGVWRESALRAGRIFELLTKANSADQGSGELYGQALRLICPESGIDDWSCVSLDRPLAPAAEDESEAAGWVRSVLRTLGDREMQCWYDWKEFEWYPWIFGLDDPPGSEVPECPKFSPLVRDRSATGSQLRMFRACASFVAGSDSDSKAALNEAIAACLHYRSTGHVESLGTYLATVYRMSRREEPEWAEAATWAIRDRDLVPAIGHAQLAIQIVAGDR